jgi:hypothetical protein
LCGLTAAVCREQKDGERKGESEEEEREKKKGGGGKDQKEEDKVGGILQKLADQLSAESSSSASLEILSAEKALSPTTSSPKLSSPKLSPTSAREVTDQDWLVGSKNSVPCTSVAVMLQDLKHSLMTATVPRTTAASTIGDLTTTSATTAKSAISEKKEGGESETGENRREKGLCNGMQGEEEKSKVSKSSTLLQGEEKSKDSKRSALLLSDSRQSSSKHEKLAELAWEEIVRKLAPSDREKCYVLDKEKLLDIALHPPPSVASATTIAESLRTVECHVSLERMSGHATARDTSRGGGQLAPSPTEATSVESSGSLAASAQQTTATLLPKGKRNDSGKGNNTITDKSGGQQTLSLAKHNESVAQGEEVDETPYANAEGERSEADGRTPPPLKSASQAALYHRSFLDFLKQSESDSGKDSDVEIVDVRSTAMEGVSSQPSTSSLASSVFSQTTVVTSESSDNQLQQSLGDVREEEEGMRNVRNQEQVQLMDIKTEPDSLPTMTSEHEPPLSVKLEPESLPLHAEIALRIKAESLARSSPGESGPFKCPTCKRLYRTAPSFQAHIKSCDFLVSSDDDDDDEARDEEDDVDDGDVKRVVDDDSQAGPVEEDEDSSDDVDGRKKGGNSGIKGNHPLSSRTSMRQSTLTQRKAMEAEQRQMKALQTSDKQISPVTALPEPSQREGEPQGHRGRGRPRKNSAQHPTESFSPKETSSDSGRQLRSGRGAMSPPGQGQHSRSRSTSRDDVGQGHDAEGTAVKRGRGRPRKVNKSFWKYSFVSDFVGVSGIV